MGREFAARLDAAIRGSGLTKRAVAASVNKVPSAVSQWLASKSEPDIATKAKHCGEWPDGRPAAGAGAGA